MRRMSTSRVLATLLLPALLAPTAAAQAVQLLIQDLGDPERSEHAERALVTLGEKAVPELSREMENWDESSAEGRRRASALLRVIRLLGPKAESLQPALTAIGGESKLAGELCRVIAGLAPYSGEYEWHMLFHHGVTGHDEVTRRQVYVACIRMQARQSVRNLDDVEAMVDVLKKDQVGAREVAAEVLAAKRDPRTLDLLRDRLLDRDRQPDGHDQLTHNGFRVPFEDEFAFCASEAMLRLGPSDPRCAIAYAHRARLHPHASLRKEALLRLATLGPAARDAIPELVELAAGADEQLSIEALKVLGMAGPGVAAHGATLRRLAAEAEGVRKRLADSLIARLEAMGAELPAAEPSAADPELVALERAVASLGADPSDEVRARLLADPRTWDLLAQRLRAERGKLPDAVLDLIAELAWQQEEGDRLQMLYRIAMVGGEHCGARMMSSMSGGAPMSESYRRTYARLLVAPDADSSELRDLLGCDNSYVRERAALHLGERQDWAAAADADKTRDALLQAVEEAPPKDNKFRTGDGSTQGVNADLRKQVRAAAAAALLHVDVPEARHQQALLAVRHHPRAELVAQAVTRWGCEATRKLVEKFAKNDEREVVRRAAEQALAKLDGGR